ncbi:MAG: ferritin family protein, partial [Candidatus Cloacimonetes bacterium]|nr:ferritin family protein [Candidatus Cloacimonadota bacterium]
MDKTQFEHLIDIGIKREEEAHSFYQFAGSRINNRAIKKIFHELATEELNHKELLLQFKQNPALHARLQAPSVEYFLAEETELPKLHQDMKPADALALAMKKEQQAVEFYKRLASNME